MLADHKTDLLNAREQLRQYIRQIEDLAALQERNRIARDIHDSLGNALTALNIQLQTVLKLWHLDPTQAEELLAEAQRLGSLAIQEVRQSVRNMRQNDLPEESPETLINSLVQNFHQTTGILPATNISLSAPLPTTVVMTIYRIVQESLTNICKYAEATEVKIYLNTNSNNLNLLIQDNGKGFSLSQKKTGFGLQGMRERVAALKGKLRIESESGSGCQITMTLPLATVSVPEEKKPEENFDLSIHGQAKSVFYTYLNPKTLKQEGRHGEAVAEYTKTEKLDESKNINVSACSSRGVPVSLHKTENNSLLILDSEQYNYLEKILVELIGPIAPTLLKKALTQALSCKELIENLANQLTSNQRFEFEKKVMFLLRKPLAKSDSQSNTSPRKNKFFSQCERELADLIGPMASFFVQKLLQSSPHISPAEFVRILAAEIPDPRQALQFERRLLSS